MTLVGRDACRIAAVRDAIDPAIQTCIGDLGDSDGPCRVIDATRPSVVFNLAGYGVDQCERDVEPMEALNVRMVERLCDRLAGQRGSEWGGVRLVHAGSEAFAQFVEEDARLLELIADRIALAINQASLYEAERAAQERLQFLAEASAILGSSLDVDKTLAELSALVVGRFADRCVFHLTSEPGEPDDAAVVAHVIRSGESIWVLAQQRYNIPIWLLRQYNPDLDLGSIRPGTKLVIPIVESTSVPADPAA